jgi:GTP cyclohydrolase I
MLPEQYEHEHEHEHEHGHSRLPFKTRLTQQCRKEMAVAMGKVLDKLLPGWQSDPSTCDTPMRFAKYLAEYAQPIDIEKIFGSDFETPAEHPGMVIQTSIPFRMVCEHHLLPATGVAALAYIPHTRVLGLSKMARLVDAVGVERPSLQEHIAHRILDLMEKHLKPKGSMIVIKAVHGCMACRGINKPGVNTITSHVQGIFRDNPVARQEALMLIQKEM